MAGMCACRVCVCSVYVCMCVCSVYVYICVCVYMCVFMCIHVCALCFLRFVLFNKPLTNNHSCLSPTPLPYTSPLHHSPTTITPPPYTTTPLPPPLPYTTTPSVSPVVLDFLSPMSEAFDTDGEAGFLSKVGWICVLGFVYLDLCTWICVLGFGFVWCMVYMDSCVWVCVYECCCVVYADTLCVMCRLYGGACAARSTYTPHICSHTSYTPSHTSYTPSHPHTQPHTLTHTLNPGVRECERCAFFNAQKHGTDGRRD